MKRSQLAAMWMKKNGSYSYPKQRKKEIGAGRLGGYKVVLREDQYPRGYIGMNWWAARPSELNIPFKHDKKTVVVWAGLGAGDQKATAVHEVDEANLMAKGMHYPEAHKIATRLEDFGMRRKIGGRTMGYRVRKTAPALLV